jgi:hypothetical protein
MTSSAAAAARTSSISPASILAAATAGDTHGSSSGLLRPLNNSARGRLPLAAARWQGRARALAAQARRRDGEAVARRSSRRSEREAEAGVEAEAEAEANRRKGWGGGEAKGEGRCGQAGLIAGRRDGIGVGGIRWPRRRAQCAVGIDCRLSLTPLSLSDCVLDLDDNDGVV